ncbi:MAG: phosphoglucomutase/phosphomannomutase family protein [Chloroflexota bacterium]|nr:phosphoglucomutase/phosphomannomutase family protein [Chloroflexota bacterium]
MADIVFGTDGWRGKVAETYTFDNVRRCAQGFASYILDLNRPEEISRGIVIGHDKRFSGEDFALAVAEVIAGNGIPVLFCDGPTPTPAISFQAVHQNALGAVNVTASHNPPADNGFKVRDPNGSAIAPEGLKQIEAFIPGTVAGARRIPIAQAEGVGLFRRFDPKPAYMARIRELVDLESIKDAGLTVVYDAMWGNGAGWFDELLSGGETEVVTIHGGLNPAFPEMDRPEPIPPNVNACLAKVSELGADVGIINDGDADRLGLADENGEFIDQLRVYGLIALYLLDVRELRKPIVKALSTTSMLERLGQKYGVEVYEVAVGFKYVAPKMMETDAMVGGEESGGYAFGNHLPERDGILAGLYILDFMVQTGKKPSELVELLFEEVGNRYYYSRVDTRFPSEKRPGAKALLDEADPKEIAGLKVVDFTGYDGYKYHMEDGGFLLIRFSGTEPIIRVYTETTREDLVDDILDAGLEIAGLKD